MARPSSYRTRYMTARIPRQRKSATISWSRAGFYAAAAGGCLETHVATHAIAERVRRACTKDSMPGLHAFVDGDVDKIEVRNMEQWIGIEDPGLQKIIDDIVERLARTVVNTITLLAPDKVIIYGFMFEMDHIQKRFLDFCTYYDSLYDGDYILKSGLSDRIGYIGPLAIVVNEMFLGM